MNRPFTLWRALSISVISETMRMLTTAVALSAILAALPAHAQRGCVATDGDTLRCGAERVRIQSLDAPEMHGRCPIETHAARSAQERLAQLIADGIILERHGTDRYRRTLAVVRDRQGRELAAIMVREGFARPYDGRSRRQGWCDG